MPYKLQSHLSFSNALHFLKTTEGQLSAATVFVLTPLQIVSFALLLIVATRLLPLGKLGIITRILLSLGLSLCMVTFIAIGAWTVGVPLSAQLILLLLIALLGLLNGQQKRKNIPELRSWRADRYEIVSAVIALISLTLIITPVLQATNAATLLRVISAGGDNSSHLDIIKTSDLNQGVAYGKNNRVNAPGGAINYPQGWHFNVAFYKWMSDPLLHYQNRPGKILLLFYTASLIWFGLLVFFITRLALRLGQLAVPKPHVVGLIAAAAVVGGATIHWLLQLFTHGFEAQTAALTLLVMAAFAVAEAFALPAAKRYPWLIVAAILAVGSNFIWVFIMPITCGGVAAGVLATTIGLKKLPSWPVIATFVLLAGIALLQPLFYLIYPVQFEFPIILQRGDIDPTSMIALLTIFGLGLIYTIARWRVRALRAVMFIAGVGIIFSFGLMLYQLHELQELRYFYYKSTYTFIVIGVAIAGAITLDIVSQFLTPARLKRAALITLCTLTVITSCLVWWQIKGPKTDAYTNGSLGGMSGPQALALINQVTKGPAVAADTIFIGSCNRGDDIRANLFIAALTFDPIRHGHSFNPGAHDQNVVFASIKQAMTEPTRNIHVISGDQVVLSHLRTYLGDVEYAKLTIVNLDTTPETEPIKQCPDRTRDIGKFPIT